MVCIAVVPWQQTKSHCVGHCTTAEMKVTQIKIPTACSVLETNSEYAQLAQPSLLWKMSVSCSDVQLSQWVSQPVAFAGQKKSQETLSCPPLYFWDPSGHCLGILSVALHPQACRIVTQRQLSQFPLCSTNGSGWSDRSSYLWLFLCLSRPIKNVYKGAVRGWRQGEQKKRNPISFGNSFRA